MGLLLPRFQVTWCYGKGRYAAYVSVPIGSFVVAPLNEVRRENTTCALLLYTVSQKKLHPSYFSNNLVEHQFIQVLLCQK